MSPLVAVLLALLYGWTSMQLLPFTFAVCGGVVLVWLLGSFLIRGPPMSTRRKLMMASWTPPSDGTVHGVITINAEALVAYLEKQAAQGNKVSVTTACIKGIALAFRECPSLNSYIAFGQFIPRPSIDVACLVAVDDGKDLANVKVTAADGKSLATISGELKSKADKLRAHKDEDFEKSKPMLSTLPVPVLGVLVNAVGYLSGAFGLNIPALGVRPFLFGSCMVTSVGMLGVEQAFVPFTPFARVPVLLMIGEIAKKAVVGANDQIVSQRQLTITGTLDHRFADGTEAAKFCKRLKFVMENPDLLDDTGVASAPAAGAVKSRSKK